MKYALALVALALCLWAPTAGAHHEHHPNQPQRPGRILYGDPAAQRRYEARPPSRIIYGSPPAPARVCNWVTMCDTNGQCDRVRVCQ